MSLSSVAEQVQELQETGFPVRQGTRITDENKESGTLTPAKFGSDLWFSRWTRNVFKNYPILSRARGARFLAEACNGLPAFVVGVGPSLDDEIKELKIIKRRAIVIAVDAALRPLLANGITPDLVISYDCKDDQNRLWRDLPPGVKIPALLNSCTHPNTIASWPGPVLFFNQYHTQDDLCFKILPDVLPELGQIPSGGTVGNMAALVAHLMGCTPVCLVGFDFCYQPIQGDVVGYRYRAQDYKYVVNRGEGVPPGWEKTEIKELYDNDERLSRTFSVKGKDGKDFKSDPELSFYLESFNYIMPHFKVPVVNCTPNGMIPQSLTTVIDGTEIKTDVPTMTLMEAAEKYCKTEYQPGRTVLPYLDVIVPDPRLPETRLA
jgi:hypothetical protein